MEGGRERERGKEGGREGGREGERHVLLLYTNIVHVHYLLAMFSTNNS